MRKRGFSPEFSVVFFSTPSKSRRNYRRADMTCYNGINERRGMMKSTHTRPSPDTRTFFISSSSFNRLLIPTRNPLPRHPHIDVTLVVEAEKKKGRKEEKKKKKINEKRKKGGESITRTPIKKLSGFLSSSGFVQRIGLLRESSTSLERRNDGILVLVLRTSVRPSPRLLPPRHH